MLNLKGNGKSSKYRVLLIIHFFSFKKNLSFKFDLYYLYLQPVSSELDNAEKAQYTVRVVVWTKLRDDFKTCLACWIVVISSSFCGPPSLWPGFSTVSDIIWILLLLLYTDHRIILSRWRSIVEVKYVFFCMSFPSDCSPRFRTTVMLPHL